MPRPRNKEDLIIAATANYEKLLNMIEKRTVYQYLLSLGGRQLYWQLFYQRDQQSL